MPRNSLRHRRGHRLHFYEPDAFSRQEHRDLEDLPWGRVTVYDPTDQAALDACLSEAARSDHVIKASGVGVNDALLEAEIARLSPAGRIFWDVDAPATLARLESDPDDPLRPLLSDYDLVLCYGGGEPVRRRYLALGARRCEIVYNALDPDAHHPVPADSRFEADLAFLGNRLPDREARVLSLFLEPARRLCDRRFLLGGNGWEDLAAGIGNLRWLGHVYTSDHNAFNATPTAVINISRNDMAAAGWSPATRVFEAAGSGACIVTDRWEGLGHFLEPGTEVLVADTTDEVVEIVRRLTRDEARRMGARARARITATHTYASRAAQLEELLC